MRLGYRLLLGGMLGTLGACSSKAPHSSLIPGSQGGGTGGAGGADGNAPEPGPVGQAGSFVLDNGDTDCQRQTCAELGWACGYLLDHCGEVVNCADEGLTCASNQICSGGIDGPTQCVAGGEADCSVCSAIPDCSSAAQPTRLTGRVVSPGRTDGDTANQVGVPNAIVYILRGENADALPPMSSGIPSGGTSCDRCEDQDLGPVLVGGVTDANGNYTLEGNVPVDRDFVLVVKAGKFRRAVTQRLEVGAACATTTLPAALPANPTRLPRTSTDGLAVNLPRVAVTTGQIDAMECVFYKMGLAPSEFGNYSASDAHRIDLYRGGSSGSPQGASINGSTPHDVALYNSLPRLEEYDMVVSDCEGQNWDSNFSQRGNGDDSSQGGNVRQYVNRGGRMFLSHLSFSWLHGNGTTPYRAATPADTGLGPAATWDTSPITDAQVGTGVVSIVGTRPRQSPRIQTFADWMAFEGVASGPDYTFRITDPRSQNTAIEAGTEEFVYRADAAPHTSESGYSATGNNRVQQFSFNTPFGAPNEAACGRVAYSGFHVAAASGQGTSPYATQTFPDHCTSATLGNGGNLTPQEKILLYMLFDLGACVGAPPVPPPCVPIECGVTSCGFAADGCGSVLDCGPCRPPA